MGHLNHKSGNRYASLESISRSLSLPSLTSNERSPRHSEGALIHAPNDQTAELPTAPSDLYRTLEVSHLHLSDLLLSIPSSPPSPSGKLGPHVFQIKRHLWHPGKHAMTLFEENNNERALGSVRLRFGRPDLFGIGTSENSMHWESLRRVSRVRHSRFEFEYGTGLSRRKFIWKRTGKGFWTDQPDLALYEVLGWSPLGMKGFVGTEALAIFKGMRWIRWKRRAFFHLKRGVIGNNRGMLVGGGQNGGEQWGEWEVVVVLTAAAIVEGAVRRANGRRNAAAIR